MKSAYFAQILRRPLYLDGDRVKPGIYRDLLTGREVQFLRGGRLPTGRHGDPACYVQLDQNIPPAKN